MRIKFNAYGNIQAATAEGIVTHEHEAGETVELPADIAALFIASGVAEPAPKAERAVKAKGETATKK